MNSNTSVRPFGFSSLFAIVLAAALGAATAFGASVTWSGASGTDTNWSTAGNWSGGASPTGDDDVQFFDTGAVTAPGVPNSFADGAFAGFIGWLQFGNTNGVHTLAVAAGTTLSLTNTGGLVVGTPGDIGAARNLTNSITGGTAKLVLDNSVAQLAINQGTATSVSGTRGNLDLSGLGTFEANLWAIGLGSTLFQNPGNAKQREAGNLLLARTNLIVLSYTDTLANYRTAGKTNALELSHNPGNHAGIMSLLSLGVTNAFFVDSMGFGRDKASLSAAAWMGFNPAFVSEEPVAYFRGAGGDNSRVTWWGIGDMNANSSSSQHSVGTNDFTGGRVDALVDMLSLGRDCSPSHTASGSGRINRGVLSFDDGVIDANTVIVGNQSLGPGTSSTPNQGFITIGSAATLRVNSMLILANTTVNSTAAANTFGRVDVKGGSLFANAISVGAYSTTNGIIAVDAGVLAVSNNLSSASKPLKDLTLTNATVVLHVSDTGPIAYLTNLTTGGDSNVISIGAAPVFGSYPVQVTLFKYSNLDGAGYNFVLGSVPGAAPDAYLSNNTLNASIDLVLPTDPRPVITSLPDSYGGSPGDSVSFTAGFSGSEPIALFWLKDGTSVVADGPTGSGSTISGADTGTLSIANAQESDSGSYALVASNPYGAVTSSPPATLIISTSDIAPIVNGPNNVTVIQGQDATLTTTVSGKPVPTMQWYKGTVELTGQTSPNLTILNAQYPADQGDYSIIASNSAGMVTNSAFLTVIVPPEIAVQPVSLVVTNTQAASFAVVSTNGVPPVTYQWRKNGSTISGATTSELNFASVSPADMGTYTVLIANAAGAVVSDPVTLTVNSTMAPTALTPDNGAANICFDTPLYITFDAAPALRKAGTIKIYNATNSATPVDTIDLSLNVDNHPVYAANVQGRLIGGEGFVSFPVIITGNTAAIYPHAGVLTTNQTYYVTIDDGVFTDPAGAYFAGIADPSVWQFTTKVALPESAATNPVIAADGSGDFATVQGALDYLTPSSATARILDIRSGTYTEIVNIKKSNVLLRGQGPASTIITYANNANLQGSTHYRMSFKVDADDISLDSLTVTNSTPKGGGQAEALMVESNRRHFLSYNTRICSFQDTILLNTEGTQCYFLKTYVQGDTDFIWGSGNAFFTNCEIKQLNASTALNPTASSSTVSSNGMSFINCTFSRAPGLTGCLMGRTRSIPNGNCAIITSRIDAHIYGWSTDALPTDSYRIWDFGNTDITGGTSKVLSNSIPLAADDPRLALASDATEWLYGWVPQLPLRIVTQPASQSVAGGATVNLTVLAAGIPEASYQWQRNGTDLPGETGATLTINSASLNDVGDYTVIVSNGVDSITSATATLTVGNSAPTLSPIPNYTVNAGETVGFTNIASDLDLPLQSLSFALVSGPTNASVDAVTGVLTFRPLISQAASSNWCVVSVSDNYAPPATAEQGFAVIVNPITQPELSAISVSGGVASFSIGGVAGPDYTIQASTNLVDWGGLYTTNSPAVPFTWTDPAAGSFNQRFYRILLGP